MIIYNLTTKVESAIAAQWLHWLNQEYAPEMLATGCFIKYQVLQLLEVDDAEGPTYAVQYFARTTADYENYQQQHADDFEAKAAAKWGGRFVAFGTLMQVVV